ncbi:MAG: protein kinase [Alphaproteobacteria bacterium]|nr:protein kinase [Alphaproteobacteria bacterium]
MSAVRTADQVLRELEERLASDDPFEVRAAVSAEREGGSTDIALHVATAAICCEIGRIREARDAGARAVALARKLDERAWIGRSVAISAWISWVEMDVTTAIQLARRARTEAGDDAWTDVVTRLVLADHARRTGDLAGALQLLASQDAALDGETSPWFGALAEVARIEVLTATGDLDGSRVELEQAFARTDPYRRVIHAWLVVALADLARAAGDEEGGRQAVDTEIAQLEGTCCASLGELLALRGWFHQQAGELEEAAQQLERAVRVFDRLANPSRHEARMSLALVHLLSGHPNLAARLLEEIPVRAVAAEQIAPLRAALAAAEGDVRRWASHHERAHQFMVGARTGSEEQALALRFAGERWASRGGQENRRRAFRARSLALHHWERLGRPVDATAELRELRLLGKVGVPVPAGPYDLLSMLGAGAMGEVWLGRHVVHDAEVAVKLLRMDATQDDFLRSSFDAEIRAIAALEHPGIVHILGHGVLDSAAAIAGKPQQVGAPWFAMELVRGGTLQDVCGRLRWSACRGILTGLLDALAHAHARDVLHLDIKPANVLLEPVGEGVRPRLGDFGLSGLVANGQLAAGTPQYMAPEQFRGRDLGPWTDLYAVGCLVWALVTGQPPYVLDDVVSLRNAHVAGQLPELDAVVQLPEGFEAWLERLLDPDPTTRFESAADASWMLHVLRDPPTDEPPRDAAPGRNQQTTPITFSLPAWGELHTADVVQADQPLLVELPPMPVSWKATPVERPRGVEALELYGLRRPPLVGRVRQRDLLWATLADVKRRGRPRLVALEGRSGTGRTHLARWFVETARERGVASGHTVRFVADLSGLSPLVRRVLRAEELEPDHLRARVARFSSRLDPNDAERLVSLAVGRAPEEEDVPAVCALLGARAGLRPLVVWMEGRPAQHPLAVALAVRLLREQAPLLVVFEASPGEDREADRRYEELLDLPPTMAVTLEALGPSELRELARELLPLDPSLIDRVVDRASSDADLVVATISDLVRRDALRDDLHGLVLRDGMELAPRANLMRAWVDKLETILDPLPLAARDALTACAVAGTDISAEGWRAVCDAVGLTAPSSLVRALRANRLIGATSLRGWSFGHWSVPVHLREEALADGRLPRLARVAADHLRFDDPGREGIALVDAGLLDRALEPLGEGLRDALARSDVGRVTALCDAMEAALRMQGIAESDPRWLGLNLSRAHLLRLQGRRDVAMELACGVVEAAGSAPSDLLYQGLTLVSALQSEAGDGVGSTATLKRALSVARTLEDPRAVAHVRLAVADAARQRGDLEGAARHYDRGLRELEGRSDLRTLASLKLGLGLVQAARGHLERAVVTLRQAMEELDATEERSGAAEARTALARIACRQGRTRDASRLFTEALDLLPPTDRARRADVLLDQCMVLLADERWEELASHVRTVLEETPGLPQDTKTWAFALLLAARVEAPEEEWSVLADTLESLLRQTVLVDADVAMVLETAAGRVAGVRARRCWTLAEAQWRTLGDRERARRARELARG